MGRRRKGEPPRYRLHKQSGQAVVSLPLGDGTYRDVLLGAYDTPESRTEYARALAEWEANGPRAPIPSGVSQGLAVNELLLAYWQHAERHYRRPDGTISDELYCIKSALRPLRELYGHTDVKDFGPLALKAVRQRMVETKSPRGKPWCRRFVNASVGRIKAVFKWGVENELVPPSVLQGLQAVRGLQAGRSAARETDPVKPVPEAFVEAVLPCVTPPVKAMIGLQLLTGMRPGEVVIMRGIDLDTSGPVWLYRPGSDRGPAGQHKTAWRGHTRIIAIGPRGQEILKAFLKTDVCAYLFSPAEAMEAVRAVRRQNRKSKVPSSQIGRRKRKPKRQPGNHYTVDSYRVAVERACHKADIPVWHPHQLRHTKATEIRREAGLDAARAVLGHRSPAITEVYAELDVGRAAEVMEKLG